MSIAVNQTSPTSFEVSVSGPTSTTHSVTVSEAYGDKLTAGRIQLSDLVERSFRFLLEREPNTSILRSFELPVIQQYFPDFEATIIASIDD